MSSVFDRPEFNLALFFPRGDANEPPDGAVDLEVRVAGATLHLRWHKRVKGAEEPTVLLFHGNGEVVADYDDAAASFAAAGADLAVVDYRGYGRSTGEPTLRAVIADAWPVLEALRGAGARNIIVMGRSLGSACAAELYGRPGIEAHARGFVWESGAADLAGLIRRRGLRAPAELDEVDVADFDPRRKLARGGLPLLVIHGERDAIIPVREAKLAHEAAGAARKELVEIARRGHNDLSLERAYWEAMARFFAGL